MIIVDINEVTLDSGMVSVQSLFHIMVHINIVSGLSWHGFISLISLSHPLTTALIFSIYKMVLLIIFHTIEIFNMFLIRGILIILLSKCDF